MQDDDFPTTANGCRLEANACRTAAARLVRQADYLEEYADQLEAVHKQAVYGRTVDRWRRLSGVTVNVTCVDCGAVATWCNEWATDQMAGLAFNYYCDVHAEERRKVRA